MLRYTRAFGLRALREAATLPLRALGKTQRGQVLERLAAAMVSEVPIVEGTLRFMASTPLLQARAAAVLSKEPDTIAWIEGFGSGDVFWDVGANVGVFSLYAARRRGVQVLAFEPFADNYMVLCKNVEINGLGERVTPYCVAVSGSTRLGVLNSQSRGLGTSLHQFGQPGDTSRYWAIKHGSYVQGMIGFSIDDFVMKFAPAFPTHLKIDVDGLELNILQGAANTLRDSRLRSVMVELSISDGEERSAGIDLLSNAGFSLESQGELQEAAGSVAANHFFAKTSG